MTSEATVPEAAVRAIASVINPQALRPRLPGHERGQCAQCDGEEEAALETGRAALTAALPHLSTAIRDAAPDTVAVPKVALDWLMGAGPDPAGLWFGDFPEDHPRPPGAFWWRTTFKEICAYVSSNALKSIPDPAEGNEAEGAEPLFSTDWERRDYLREKAGLKPLGPAAPAQAPGELVEQLRELRDRLNGESPQASKWPSIVEDAIAALTRQEQRGAVEVKLEDAAKAAFKQAQSVYRAEYDHFPLSTVWETTDEAVRDGWRKIAAAALAATPVHQEAGE